MPLSEEQVKQLFYSIKFESVADLERVLKELSESASATEIITTSADPTQYADSAPVIHAACARNDDSERCERVVFLLDQLSPAQAKAELARRGGAFSRTPLMHAAAKFDAKLVATVIDRLADPKTELLAKDQMGFTPMESSWRNNYSQYNAAAQIYTSALRLGIDEEVMSVLDDGNRRMFFRDIWPTYANMCEAVPSKSADGAAIKPTSKSVGEFAAPVDGAPPLGPHVFDYRGQVEYEQRVQELEAYNDEYVSRHPELQQLLHDLMQSVLIHKPEDALEFIGDHFRNHYTTVQE